VLVVGW